MHLQAAVTDIQQIRKAELARLRAAQAQPARAATGEPNAVLAPAGVSERNRAAILAKINAIEAQMRAQWAATNPANALKP